MSHVERTREFFGPRAASWDQRFPDDAAAFRAAVAELAPATGSVIADLGCGTGRALPFLRDAVGASGLVLGVDITPEMLDAAAPNTHAAHGVLVLADVTRLPVRAESLDAVFAAGLLAHLPDPGAFLRSLADAARPGARLALFHPIGRAALARRHNRALGTDELLDPRVLPGVLAVNGWTLATLDDAETRYLAIAIRQFAG
jgi:SAM-dependent methyltransferase